MRAIPRELIYMSYKVLGVNSGGGVSLFPFEQGDIVGNIETRSVFYTKDDAQWHLNFKAPFIRDYDQALAELKEKKMKIDIIVSSPNCGSGSVLRYSRAKKLGDNKENVSLLQFINSVRKLKPKFFLFENLQALYKSFPKDEFKANFKKYHFISFKKPVSAWGNSQVNRKRLIIVGVRKDLGHDRAYWKKIFKLPKIASDELQTCGELYKDLDKNASFGGGNIREYMGNTITMYGGFRLGLSEIRDLWLNEYAGKKRWPAIDRKYSNAPGVYRNLLNDYPATARKANRQFDHNGLMLTPRQLARIQGVPDIFKLWYDHEMDHNYCINKGRTVVTKTPPYEISEWFVECLEKLEK